MANDEPHFPDSMRRSLLLTPLLAALPQLLTAVAAEAAPDPTKTIIMPPKDVKFEPALGAPPDSLEEASLFSTSSDPGIYLNLTKWYRDG